MCISDSCSSACWSLPPLPSPGSRATWCTGCSAGSTRTRPFEGPRGTRPHERGGIPDMPFAIPEGLAPEVYPLSWLVGWWRGPGKLGYPGIEERPFVQTIQFDHDGGPYLTYSSTNCLFLAGVDSTSAPAPDSEADLAEGGQGVEVMITDPSGHLSLYLGAIGNGRVELASDLIARTSTAAEVSAATRLYGRVQGELMWTWDMAAFGQPLQPYASARLSRQD